MRSFCPNLTFAIAVSYISPHMALLLLSIYYTPSPLSVCCDPYVLSCSNSVYLRNTLVGKTML